MVTFKSAKASQDFVPIKEIRNGVVILKDGGMRAVVMTSSVNLALKGIDEQKGIIAQFQNFLNSLDFPVQIYIQSRKLDINPYIELLEDRYKQTVDDLLRFQIREYIEFIKSFVEQTNIMTKHFFVVVPYDPPVVSTTSSASFIEKITGQKKDEKIDDANFSYHVTQLDQRVAVVQQGLTRCGVKSVQLNTEELIELFYKIFNPQGQEDAVRMLQ